MNEVPGRPQELVALLARRAGARSSGILSAVRGKLKRLLCLERGKLRFAVSNVLEEQFSERLVASEVLGSADLVACRREAQRTGQNVDSVIRDSGLVPEDVLHRIMSDHIVELTRTCLEWPDGAFAFETGNPGLAGRVTSDVAVPPLIFAHVSRFPGSLDAVRFRIGPPDTRIGVAADNRKVLDGLDLGPTVRFLLEVAGEGTPLTGLSTRAPDGESALLRAVYGLLLLGVLQRVERIRPDRASLREVTREEVEGWIAKARNADYYTVLGIDGSATVEDVRDAYYQLARRMHPDRFRAGLLTNLLDKVESFFTKVTEAYNTLSDPERRDEYDKQLAELAGRSPEDQKTDTTYLARQNFLRGRTLADKKRFVEAVGFLENAIDLDDTVAEYHLELGNVLAINPRHRAQAERHLLRCSEIDPSVVEPYLALGELYVKMSRLPDAARMFREVLRWEPGNELARSQLEALGDDDKAKKGGLFGR